MANCKICNDTGRDPGIYNESNPNSSDTWQGGGNCSCPAGKRRTNNKGCLSIVVLLVSSSILFLTLIIKLI